ncbi:hypothetical protein EDM68_04610 [Candidatus Uhrbacteria bacterium]|nr:MAG: hypothetical protein EDM68_04610 [Candidatus Uhrbacteria bacterium]
MSRRRRRGGRATSWVGAIVATVLVAGVAYTLNQPAPAADASPSATTPVIAADEVPRRVLVGVRLANADRDGLYAVDLRDGEATAVEVAKGWRVESMHEASALRLVPNDDRGVTLTDGGDWNVVLRAPTGEAYAEPRLLGMFDERHAAVVARTDRVRVLNVSRAGQITSIADIPEFANVLGFSGGAVWFSTFTPGEGIESGPSGPSGLYKISAHGDKDLVSGSKDSVFVGVLSIDERVATWMQNGSFTATASDGFGLSGLGMPLLWIEDRLLVADGPDLLLYGSTAEGHEPVDLRVHLTGSPAVAKMAE